MMKKILITGMNQNQCVRKFYLRQQLKVIPSHYSLYNCLVDMGYEVEQRAVDLGEDLSGYDEVFVYIAGPRQLVATKLYNGLWAIANRPDCVLLMDDWQVPDLFKGVIKCADWKELTADFILGVNKTTEAELLPFKHELLGAINIISNRQNRMLISAFDTSHLPEGNGPELLFGTIKYPPNRLFTFNPNPYHRNRTPFDIGHEGPEDPDFNCLIKSQTIEPVTKERRFNFASLVQSKTQKWLKKQGFTGNIKDAEQGMIGTWQVDLYGSRAETQKRLTEDQMCTVFARDWACLMPGYEHSGSGWWRARPLQAADAGCILIGDPKEMAVYYGTNFPLLELTAEDLMEATDYQLDHVVKSQQSAIYNMHPLDKLIQQQELKSVLSAPRQQAEIIRQVRCTA